MGLLWWSTLIGKEMMVVKGLEFVWRILERHGDLFLFIPRLAFDQLLHPIANAFNHLVKHF